MLEKTYVWAIIDNDGKIGYQQISDASHETVNDCFPEIFGYSRFGYESIEQAELALDMYLQRNLFYINDYILLTIYNRKKEKIFAKPSLPRTESCLGY